MKKETAREWLKANFPVEAEAEILKQVLHTYGLHGATLALSRAHRKGIAATSIEEITWRLRHLAENYLPNTLFYTPDLDEFSTSTDEAAFWYGQECRIEEYPTTEVVFGRRVHMLMRN